jgi:hypothetical protein
LAEAVCGGEPAKSLFDIVQGFVYGFCVGARMQPLFTRFFVCGRGATPYSRYFF